MALPLKYNLRNLRVRWRSSLGTVFSIALVVAVFVMVMALASGLKATYRTSGDPRNLLVLRQGALAESSSQISFQEVQLTRYLTDIARNAQGQPLASPEMIILITLERHDAGQAHVQVRGLGPVGLQLRPEVRLVQGRFFEPGRRECIVSRNIARRFKQCGLGQTFRSGRHTWTVVGLFEAGQTAYDSEIWMDADEARNAFNRSFYCSVVLRPANPAAAQEIRRRIRNDPRLQLDVLTEREYYDQQVETAAPLQIFGACLAGIMSIGAAFFAMNTLYASVGRRTREIGTLRVLGFKRRSIYASFMVESACMAVVGGVLGCLLAIPIHGLATGTFSWKTFAEVAFEFRVTGTLLAAGMVFALGIGLLGGLLPAWHASRQSILDGLRAH